MAALLVILLIPSIIVMSSIINGYVVSVLWSWFMVSTFELPHLSVPAAIGLALMVHVLVPVKADPVLKVETSSATVVLSAAIANILLRAGILLGIGWIIRQFM